MHYRDNPQQRLRHHIKWTGFTPPNWTDFAPPLTRILESLTEPFDLHGEEGRISASIGISIYPEQADDDKQLLHNADVAMFHAKSQGKANYQFYRDGLEIEGVPEREAH